jgi:hypothetical protein
MVATENKAINPDLEQDMAKRAGSSTVEIGSGHAVILSHPTQVAQFIEKVARESVADPLLYGGSQPHGSL